MQPGDVVSTYANVESLFDYIDFKPETKLKDGIKAFVDKYLELEKRKI
jgi:UDP-glucuronate 4-epimerase